MRYRELKFGEFGGK